MTKIIGEWIGTLIPFLPFLAIPAWNGWKLAQGLRAGDWNRPGWFARAAWTSFFVTVMVWVWSSFAAGGILDLEKVCGVWHQQPYDRAFRDAHQEEWTRIFPLSSKCNAHYDLVPGWVNPTVALFFLLFVLSLAGLIWTTTQRLRETATRP